MNEEPGQPYYIVPKCDKAVDILYQDEHLLVINKPEFLLSVPGRAPENKDCVITRLQENFPDAVMVHRLDLDTSGILIVPIVRSAMSHIARQFQERKIEKRYEAVVWGKVKEKAGCIELPIKADWENRPLQCIDFEGGKKANTHYRVLKDVDHSVAITDQQVEQTRLSLKPITGRSHQLRIHCREIGHPIIGCDMYAHKDALDACPRLLLHACEISFTHPHTGKKMTVESPVPF
jgi:tRNA pseudouridine32 synthase/23S rRNA pseudouridine746 synthase